MSRSKPLAVLRGHPDGDLEIGTESRGVRGYRALHHAKDRPDEAHRALASAIIARSGIRKRCAHPDPEVSDDLLSLGPSPQAREL
jgi:hypothetical protein